ncbi:hypothetical protein GOBAR_AA00474 [Gossypium barbadense]|uniref:Uncharacterized protein n=1 Tax=Gossypium barbadense TaxID=3634 RepID=A0A2P5YWX5_GOSBA|nr:hypothetical protein GOBAR_AA00474 [Gossypium barbadense]
MLSQTNLNWSASQNISSTSIILTTKDFSKGGGQTTKPMGNNSKISSSAPFIKRLTRVEMAERRAKGLCYNCDESYSMGHRCKRLFWIKVPDIEYEQDDKVDDLEISLQAIRGTCNSYTMQLTTNVSGKIVLVLVDSRSTYNFQRKGLVPRLGLKIQKNLGCKYVWQMKNEFLA